MRSAVRYSLLLVLLGTAGRLVAENKLFMDPQTVAVGATNVSVPVYLDNDQILFGFQLSLSTNVALLRITGMDVDGTVVADPIAQGGFSYGQVLDGGARVTWGVVLDVTEPFDVSKVIPVGKKLLVAKLHVDVTAAAAGPASIAFLDFPANPPVPPAKNVLVGDQGARMPFTTTSGAITIEQGGVTFTRGDANRDTKLDISDAVYTLNFLFLGGGEPACLESADSDDSGVVNITDPIYSLAFLFQGGASPPAPFPDPGKDSTPEEPPLGCIGP